MNVLMNALPAVSSLLPYTKVTIISETLETVNGFPITTKKEIEAFVHYQPEDFQTEINVSNVITSKRAYKFYVLENLLEVLDAIKNEASYLEFDNSSFKIYEKKDWHLNGWIEFKGVEA